MLCVRFAVLALERAHQAAHRQDRVSDQYTGELCHITTQAGDCCAEIFREQNRKSDYEGKEKCEKAWCAQAHVLSTS